LGARTTPQGLDAIVLALLERVHIQITVAGPNRGA